MNDHCLVFYADRKSKIATLSVRILNPGLPPSWCTVKNRIKWKMFYLTIENEI